LAYAPYSPLSASSSNPSNTDIGRSAKEANHKSLVLTLSVDSIHHVNCLRATGYLAVVAEGGVPTYSYAWSNGLTGQVATSLAPGTYDITVTDVEGTTATVSATILQDLTLPSANAGVDFTAPCTNSVLTLSGSGSVGAEFTYLWTASNGGVIQSGGNTLNPVISHVGVFTLRVTNTDNGCTATDAVIVGATFQPPTAIATGGAITCGEPYAVLGATFNSNNIIYEWKGPGGFSSHVLTPKVDVPGIYTFVLTDTITTCIGSDTALVAIDTISPTATAGGGGTITCALPSVTLTGAGTPVGVTFSWTGPNGFASNLQNPSVTAAGTYILTVTRPSNGCTATSSIVVAENTTPPTASATVSGPITCANSSVQLFGNGAPVGVTYAWTGPSGFNSTLQNPIVFNTGPYFLTVRNPANGCTAASFVNVISNTTPPGVTATGGVKTCTNPTVTLTATSPTPGVIYNWSGPNGYMSSQQNPTVTAIGSYTVTVTNLDNGCKSIQSVTVTQNTVAPSLSVTSPTITCFNLSPEVVASSQASGAVFNWTGPNGFTANVPNPEVIVSGYYFVTVTNPVNGCTNSANTYVYDNAIVPTVYAGDDRALNCVFSSILANPIGTSTGSNLTYQWTTFDGNIINGANTLYASFDTAGTYTLTVYNTQNGCSAADSMEVTEALPVTGTITQLAPITCNGNTGGSVRVNASGGNFIYTYAWSNGATTATISNLAAGDYTVTITDGAGCTGIATITLTQPPALQANATATAQTVANLNDGTASVAPAGGIPPYNIIWSTGATTPSIGNLAPGDYTVTLTDGSGCSTVATVTVTAAPCALVGTLEVVSVNCFESTNGSATVNTTGASGNQTYQWSNGDSTQTSSNLAVGEYTVTVTDDIGCSLTLTAQITSPPQIVVNVANQTSVLCPDSPTGEAALEVTGGVSPYTYAWPNGDTSATVSNLTAGTFVCTVTDANGCAKNQTVEIVATDSVVPQLVLKNASVSIGANGQAVVTPDMFDNGSTDNCNIADWTVSPTSFDCAQMGSRIVTLTATDNNGNSATGTAIVTVTDDTAPTLTCPQDVNASLCAPSVTFNLPEVTDNCPVNGTPELQSGLPSGSIFPLGATQQTFSFTDTSGNTGTCSFTVTVFDSIGVTASATQASCSSGCDGTVSLSITGGNLPVNVSWSNGQTGTNLSDLCADTYEATLTDASGCSVTQSVQITAQDTEAPTLTCPANITVGFCNAAVSFDLPDVLDNCVVDTQQVELTAGLASGSDFPVGTTTETFRYTDGGGNSGECSFTVTVNPQLNLAVDQVLPDPNGAGVGSISITVTGGTQPYTFAWTRNGLPFATTEDLTNLLIGTYAVTVTDTDGCTVANASINLGTTSANEVDNDLSWALYPNPATSEVFLQINDLQADDFKLSIFDTTGKLLREQLVNASGRVDLGGLPDGLLLFRLAGENGFQVKTLVKTR
jgi:hypothetical protein